jgi:GNAT superfamily N-acetyltransferase
MGLTNLFSLKIKTEDFDIVVKKLELMKKLRELTLHPHSGLNYELNHLTKSSETRSVNAKVLLAYHKRELVGWALLSREKSDFYFQNTYDGYDPARGTLFEVFVAPDHRKQGIGSALLKSARRKAGSMRLCVCPWDYQSERFYQNFDHYKNVKM